MIVNYESNPINSIIYTASIILETLKKSNGRISFNMLHDYCLNKQMEYSIFILTLDWMFLVGLIKEINEHNEVVLCD